MSKKEGEEEVKKRTRKSNSKCQKRGGRGTRRGGRLKGSS